MPKQRITKEQLLDAALDLLKEQGPEAVTVTSIAARTGCSVPPVYTCWAKVSDMWRELEAQAAAKVRFLAAEKTDGQDPFRMTGHAFATVAADHPHLFRVFACRQRPEVKTLDELLQAEAYPAIAERLAQSLGTSTAAARKLHLQMLIFNVGLSTILTSCSLEMDPGEVFGQLDDAYRAFAVQAAEEKSE